LNRALPELPLAVLTERYRRLFIAIWAGASSSRDDHRLAPTSPRAARLRLVPPLPRDRDAAERAPTPHGAVPAHTPGATHVAGFDEFGTPRATLVDPKGNELDIGAGTF
jgi:hypothetical protein